MRASAGEDTRAAACYSALLVNVGCRADAREQVHWFGDDIEFKTTKYADGQCVAPGLVIESSADSSQ